MSMKKGLQDHPCHQVTRAAIFLGLLGLPGHRQKSQEEKAGMTAARMGIRRVRRDRRRREEKLKRAANHRASQRAKLVEQAEESKEKNLADRKALAERMQIYSIPPQRWLLLSKILRASMMLHTPAKLAKVLSSDSDLSREGLRSFSRSCLFSAAHSS